MCLFKVYQKARMAPNTEHDPAFNMAYFINKYGVHISSDIILMTAQMEKKTF